MRIQIPTLLMFALLGVGTAHAEDQNNGSSATNAASASTNQDVKLKGVLSQTKVLRLDQSTIEKVKLAQAKVKVSGSSRGTNGGPQTIQEAGEYLLKNVALVGPPGACVEYEGTFYFSFSGATAASADTNLFSGLAIKKGDPTIYSWHRDGTESKK